ncbi:protein kilB [Streptomyces sp. NPDC059991]|uniref:protein kilB n=1 Tax=Streptomyces sp. NPDC059991 TaxID=3347028 RepID=UPI0036B93984
MWGSVIAVVGTLLGSVTAFLLQQISTRTTTLRRDRLVAVTALTVALADHRRAMWVREELRLTGAGPAAYEAARSESHTTRSAITAPLTTLAMLAPDLSASAQRAAEAVYALRAAADLQTLTARRATAIEASDRLVRVAAKAI